jgi:Mg-chelatase subunit ChlD
MSDEPRDDDAPDADDRVERSLRWRLILGRYSEDHLGMDGLNQRGSPEAAQRVREGMRLDAALSFIYDREHDRRAHRSASPDCPDTVSVPAWLAQVRDLFPSEAAHILEQDALTRYGVRELITDPDVLRAAEPTEALLHAILEFKALMTGDVLQAAREVVAAIVARIQERFKRDLAPALFGARTPSPEHAQRTFRNLDMRRTIRRNLRHWDPEREQLVIDRLYFHQRQRRRHSHRVIVAVDQSGSMTSNLIHAAVMASIFASLPALSVHLVLWDHRVMDVTELVHDPVEVLMSAQLGGGTLLLPALTYCQTLIAQPERTLLVVLSDWELFGEQEACLAMAQDLRAGGVKCIGLNALDAACHPVYNERFARDLAGVGWTVATMTPLQLAEHIGRLTD